MYFGICWIVVCLELNTQRITTNKTWQMPKTKQRKKLNNWLFNFCAFKNTKPNVASDRCPNSGCNLNMVVWMKERWNETRCLTGVYRSKKKNSKTTFLFSSSSTRQPRMWRAVADLEAEIQLKDSQSENIRCDSHPSNCLSVCGALKYKGKLSP